MPKDIAVISYNLNPQSPNTADAIVFQDTLNDNGYSAELVHQWSLKEESSQFKSNRDWGRYDGIVICDFWGYWNLRELILSGRPVICANRGFADDLGLGAFSDSSEHIYEDDFRIINNTHPITAGFSLGSIDIGTPVFVDSIYTGNHYVDNLITTLSNSPVLVAHKTYPLVYFGWNRYISKASTGSQLFELIVKSANWAFSGP